MGLVNQVSRLSFQQINFLRSEKLKLLKTFELSPAENTVRLALLSSILSVSLVNILATDPVFSPTPPLLRNPESCFLPQFPMRVGSQ